MGGVEIGAVRSIILSVQKDKLVYDVPVIIEIDPSLIMFEGDRNFGKNELVKRLIDKGLRAQLSLQSIVTGQMMIELKFLPHIPIRLAGLESGYLEIPTAPSSMDQLTQKIGKLPIEQITQALLDVVKNIDNVVGSEEIKGILGNVETATEKLNTFLEDTNGMEKRLDDRVERISKSLESTLDDARVLINNANDQIQPLSERAKTSLESVKETIDQVQTTLKYVDGSIGENSDTRHKLNKSLDEIGAAARALKSLSDYLERHPEAFLRGKGGQS